MSDDLFANSFSQLSDHLINYRKRLDTFSTELDNLLNRMAPYPQPDADSNDPMLKLLAVHLDETDELYSHAEQFQTALTWLISSGQATPLICQLPYHLQPPHFLYQGYVCQNNPSHVFCRKHHLNRCVICGGALK